MQTRLLYLFTRTPLHVGAGSSVGAIDQPIVRERHTGFPIIPGSAIKGVLADAWNDSLKLDARGQRSRGDSDAAWLFGSDNAANASAGALLFAEARLLAFPVRSARGAFAWVTSPLVLARAARDGVIPRDAVPTEIEDGKACFQKAGPLALGDRLVLEEYAFSHLGDTSAVLRDALSSRLPSDVVAGSLSNRLVVLSDGQLAFFAQNACEVAQHVRINDSTGVVDGSGLFNQENVPAETLFYAVVRATDGRGPVVSRGAGEALKVLGEKLQALGHIAQFGGDGSTGLGFCSLNLSNPL